MKDASPIPSKDWEKKAIRHTILLTGTVFLAQVALFLRGFIAAKFLGPSLYGLWHGLRVIINNSEFSCMGLFEGMKREVPFHQGKGDFEKAEKMISASFFSGLVLVSLAASLLFILSLLFSYRFDQTTLICLWIVAGILIARQLYLFCIKRFESEGRFFSRSKTDLIYAWLGVSLSLGLMIPLRLYGFLIGILLGYLLAFLSVLRRESMVKRTADTLRTSIELAKVGLPIILIGFLLSVLNSLDKLMILYLSDRTQLGYYGIAIVATNPIGLLPNNLRSVLYPRLLEKYGAKGDKLYLEGFLTEPSLLLVFLTLLLIGAVYCFVPAGIPIFLPQYTPSIPSLKILVVGSYFVALSQIPLSILIGIKLQRELIPVILGAILVLGITCAAALSLGYGIEGVAFSNAVTDLFLASAILWVAANQFHYSFKEKVRLFSSIYLPFLYALAVLLLLDFVAHPLRNRLSPALLVTFLQFVVFLCFLVPIFLYVNKKINIVTRFLNAVRAKDGITKGSFFED